MKNRKIVVAAFLLCAVMLLGVGYAALTDTLTINGQLKADNSKSEQDFDLDIYFARESMIVHDDSDNQAALQVADGRDDATIIAQHFTVKDQVVKVKMVIQNDSPEFDALITTEDIDVIVTPGTEGHDAVFDTTWSWAEDAVDQDDKTVPKNGGQLNLWVTITLKETPVDDTHTAEFTITFTATAVADPDTSSNESADSESVEAE